MSDVGVVARGIRTPIIRSGNDLSQIVVDSIMKASKTDNPNFDDKDIIAVTEAVVSIAQGNYATLDQIAYDVKEKFSSKHIGLVFPILSRNRFANLLRAIARNDKLTILLSYPGTAIMNPYLKDFWLTPSRFKVLYGGRDSSKSWDAAANAIRLANSLKLKFLCTRMFQNRIEESVYTLLKEQIYRFGFQKDYTILNNKI